MIVFNVLGLPAPQGSKRHVGNGRMVEMSKKVGPWREAVRSETQRAVERHPLTLPMTGAVLVRLQFALARPKGHYRTGRFAGQLRPSAPKFPAGTPDLDKLVRAVLDGLTMGHAWKDDGQVCHIEAWKIYGAPGCLIELMEAEES